MSEPLPDPDPQPVPAEFFEKLAAIKSREESPPPAGPEELIDKAARPLAENALRRYASEYVADHLSADDFMDDAREDVAALAAAGLLADPEQGSELERLKAFERDSLRQIHASWELADRYKAWREDAEDERDLALWLHAEAVWFLEQKQRELGMLHRQWSGARKTAGQRTSERDQLQARIDKALALTEPNPLLHSYTSRCFRDALLPPEPSSAVGPEPEIPLMSERRIPPPSTAQITRYRPLPVLPGDETPQPEED